MKYDLVFEGGGAKGMVFVGALKVFENAGHEPARLMGTSAGAITAALMTAGYDSSKMAEAMDERVDGKPVFASFMDPPEASGFSEEDIRNSLTRQIMDGIDVPGIPKRVEDWIDDRMIAQLMKSAHYRTLFSFIERGGLYWGNNFLQWFKRKLDASDVANSDMTFDELHRATGKDLSLCASNTTKRQLLVLNHRTAPDCPVAWAVRMSMSIPFAFQEVRWQQAWGPYRLLNADGDVATEQNLSERGGDTIVDGGVLSNFPIEYLTSDEPHVGAAMGRADPTENSTLGLLIDESKTVTGAPEPPDEGDGEDGLVDDIQQLRTVRRVMRLMNTMTDAHDNKIIQQHEDQICRLPAEGYGTMEFDMTDDRRTALIEGGAAAMREFLNRP